METPNQNNHPSARPGRKLSHSQRRLKKFYLQAIKHTYNSMREYGEYNNMMDFMTDHTDRMENLFHLLRGDWSNHIRSLQEMGHFYLLHAREDKQAMASIALIEVVELLNGLDRNSQLIFELSYYYEKLDAQFTEIRDIEQESIDCDKEKIP